jgi:AcrR family transcriptional regulator
VTVSTKGDRTRQSLLAAAVVRFAREGYRGSSVADICRDAGLSTTASYPYFANKEALFVAAVDEDVAGLITDGISLVVIDQSPKHWGRLLMSGLIERMDEHPLARRIVSGLEPEFTIRLLDIPALTQLRKDVAALIASQQLSGGVRADIEPVQMANGIVIIVISLLMSTVQTGSAGYALLADDVEAVLHAATRPPV